MNNPGIYSLGDVALTAINAATAATVVTSNGYINDLDGMLSATLEVNFTWGSGGTSIKATVETSVNQGATWVEVARFALAGASEENMVNLSGLTPVTTVYTPAALSDDSVKDGFIGERWRAKIITVGTFAGNTALAIRLIAR